MKLDCCSNSKDLKIKQKPNKQNPKNKLKKTQQKNPTIKTLTKTKPQQQNKKPKQISLYSENFKFHKALSFREEI